MATMSAALHGATVRLAEAGVEDAGAEARLLLAMALGVGREGLLMAHLRELSRDEKSRFENLIARRAGREPAAYIRGAREFWSLDFLVNRHVLIPRPDSETLIEAALERIDDRAAPRRLLDFGTGSGCLLLALLSELPNATGVGVDISPAAVALARRNGAALGLERRAAFLCARWGRALGGSFDVIIANPPYIEARAIAGLAPEVARYEPLAALDGGADGLACYRDLAPDVARLLKPGGFAVIEVGAGAADGVAAILAAGGLREIGRRRDLAGIERAILAAQ